MVPNESTPQHSSFMTDEIRNMIGMETEWGPYCDPIPESEVRRFVHAVMDDNRIYYDEDYARPTKYGRVVCPPLFHSYSRRGFGEPDSLDRLKTDPDWDALDQSGLASTGVGPATGLPPVTHGFPRMVNGGLEIELFKRTYPGMRVRSKTRYHDISERVGRTGPMALITRETVYEDQAGDLISKVRQTSIYR